MQFSVIFCLRVQSCAGVLWVPVVFSVLVEHHFFHLVLLIIHPVSFCPSVAFVFTTPTPVPAPPIYILILCFFPVFFFVFIILGSFFVSSLLHATVAQNSFILREPSRHRIELHFSAATRIEI